MTEQDNARRSDLIDQESIGRTAVLTALRAPWPEAWKDTAGLDMQAYGAASLIGVALARELDRRRAGA